MSSLSSLKLFLFIHIFSLSSLFIVQAVAEADEAQPFPSAPPVEERDRRIVGDPNNRKPVTGSWNPNRYSEGYVLGVIGEVVGQGVMIRTLEGSIKLGRLSSRGGYMDTRCFMREMEGIGPTHSEYGRRREQAIRDCTEFINPWRFSHYDHTLVSAFEQLGNHSVLAFYRSYFIMPFLNSDNYLMEIYPVNPQAIAVGASYEVASMPISRNFHYAAGFFEGRVVKASLDGVVRKAYEVTIQVSNAGDTFQRLSVNDQGLFEFILQAMVANQYLRVHYYQLFSFIGFPLSLIRGYDTYTRVFRVEVIPEPEGPAPPL